MTEIRTSQIGCRVVIRMTEMTCHTPQDIMSSPLVARVVQRFLDHLAKHDSPLLAAAGGLSLTVEAPDEVSEAAGTIADLLRLLVDTRPELIRQMVPSLAPLIATPQPMADFVDRLYNFWRDYERFLIFEDSAEESRDHAVEGHLPFVRANDELKSLVLDAYRWIDSNLRGYWPRVYHQVPAGASVGLLVDNITWPCPDGPYAILRDIPFVRLALLELPVVLYPRRNFRKGAFVPVADNPLAGAVIDPSQWYCLPLLVGPLVIHAFFHEDYLGLASSLVNLFEIANNADARRQPDGIMVFGVPAEHLGAEQTVFYEDTEHDLVLGVIGHSEDVDYFGYFKKMILTLHNVAMIRRGRLPIHGAMCRIELKDGSAANIVIVGDSGAGKSESLEAFRVLAHEHLRAMTIIFDDMGSLALSPDGRIAGYGTETGAFVRLDDLQPGYAFGQMDRSIFMSPHQTNARVVIPVTTYDEVMAGYPIDMLLYANNFEPIDAAHPHVEFFADPDAAIPVFRDGQRAAKGTTDERGLVRTYYANPFGPMQMTDRHDPLAQQFFHAIFAAGVRVGQLRTQLGIPGQEQTGPESAAHALFQVIKSAAVNTPTH